MKDSIKEPLREPLKEFTNSLDCMKDSNTYLDSMAMLGLCLQYGGRYAEAQQVSFDTVVGLF